MDSLVVGAPGKVILHGEHAVVYGKRAIAVSVGLFTKLSMQKSSTVRIDFPEIGIDATLSNESLIELRNQLPESFRFEKLNENWEIPIDERVRNILGDYCDRQEALAKCDEALKPAQRAAFQSFLFLYFGIFDSIIPFHFHIETELPVGAGLGSSASFAVALAGGILIGSQREPVSGFNVETINRWAFVSEKFVHGSPSGVDNSVASYGGGIIFRKGQPLEHIPNCPDFHVLLVNTKVPRSTKLLVQKVAELKEDNPSLFQKSMNDIDDIVGKCIELIQTEKCISGELLRKNQEILAELGVSHSSLSQIIQLGKDKTELDGKLTGAGGGGCAFIYIPPNSTTNEQSIKNLIDELKLKGYDVWNTKLGCKGFTIF